MTNKDNITLPRELAEKALEAFYYAERNHEGGFYGDSITALRTHLGAQEPVAWAYCPECGSLDVRHEEGSHKQCATCFQEWFSDIDYSDVVQQNLNRLYTALAATKQEPVAKACWACNGKGCLRDIDTGGLLPCVVCKPQEDKQ